MSSPTATRQPRRPGRPPIPPIRPAAEKPKQPVERFAFRIPEAAEALGISTAALERRVKEGIIPSVKIVGVRLILRKTLVDLDLVIEQRQAS